VTQLITKHMMPTAPPPHRLTAPTIPSFPSLPTSPTIPSIPTGPGTPPASRRPPAGTGRREHMSRYMPCLR
jgi:hypothetical protein